MAAYFDGSVDRLVNLTPPVPINYPISAGLWLNLGAVGTVIRTLFSFSRTDVANDWVKIRMGSAEEIGVSARNATYANAVATSSVTTPLIAGRWTYVLVRFISATMRRVSVLHPSGAIEHAFSTPSVVTTGINNVCIGGLHTSTPGEYWLGSIEHVWYTNTDIQPDGAQLNDDLVRQIAYGGPFSVPHIAPSVIEYLSLVEDVSFNHEGSYSPYGAQPWTKLGEVRTAPGVPLPYWHEKPKVQPHVVVV